MNEQQQADLFSEQLDHLLQGEPTTLPPDAGDLPELFEIIEPAIYHTHFQARSAAQAAFQSQMAGWFGLANGGSPMTILGLSKVWFISIVVAVITVVTGAGFIGLVTTSIFVFSGVGQVPSSPTATTTTTVVTTATPAATLAITSTATPVMTGTPVVTPTVIHGHQAGDTLPPNYHAGPGQPSWGQPNGTCNGDDCRPVGTWPGQLSGGSSGNLIGPGGGHSGGGGNDSDGNGGNHDDHSGGGDDCCQGGHH